MFAVTNCGIPSLITNSTLKNFIESKRLTLNEENKLSFALDKPQIGFRTSEFSSALFLV